jgi:hypothetical protein
LVSPIFLDIAEVILGQFPDISDHLERSAATGQGHEADHPQDAFPFLFHFNPYKRHTRASIFIESHARRFSFFRQWILEEKDNFMVFGVK